MCGVKRPALSTAQPLSVVPDISAIDCRLVQLRGIALSSAYSKQRESMKKEFSAFLCSLPRAKTLFSATPKDLCRFLAWKDSRGKTQVHVSTCPFLGKHKVHNCGCPVRLSYATVDSYIGKLRAIFKDAGREGDWNTALSLRNPAASAEVKASLSTLLLLLSRRCCFSWSKSFHCPPLSREKCYFLVLLLLTCLSMQETLLSLRCSFSVETVQTTLPW